MRQQINLYQPIFRGERKLFSAPVVGIILLVIAVGLVGIWVYGGQQVKKLEAEVMTLRELQKGNEARMGSLGTLQDSRANPADVEAKTKALSEELAARTRALSALQSGAAGQASGFASKMEALARGHVDGLWLDHVILTSEGASMSLSGGTSDPDLVPRYLKALSSEPVLAGTRFTEFVIEGPKSKDIAAAREPSAVVATEGLRFRAASAGVIEVRVGDKS